MRLDRSTVSYVRAYMSKRATTVGAIGIGSAIVLSRIFYIIGFGDRSSKTSYYDELRRVPKQGCHQRRKIIEFQEKKRRVEDSDSERRGEKRD